jgi:hypothetical protein
MGTPPHGDLRLAAGAMVQPIVRRKNEIHRILRSEEVIMVTAANEGLIDGDSGLQCSSQDIAKTKPRADNLISFIKS